MVVNVVVLDKTYDPRAIESNVGCLWREKGHMAASPLSVGPVFSLIMPPPNVTGVLHMGHALTFTLQDILGRYHRMQGRDVLLQPGTDHAGISTQLLVERHLAQEGKSRSQMGRKAFLERVWSWKAQSETGILDQLKRLGVAADWERARFTLDLGVSQAVQDVFVSLYRANLIYKDKRLVHWDPHVQTALSDLEVQVQNTSTILYYIDYPVVGCERTISVATTRPETLFGDMAIAVHPEDERYQSLIGKRVRVPLADREIPVIADFYCDPLKGSGAVKITPAHDFNDFEVGKRHGLNTVNILDIYGRLNDLVSEPFRGLDRFTARHRVLEALKNQGLLRGEEEVIAPIPYGERSGQPLEPFLTDQWYVRAQELAIPALEACDQGRLRFVPHHWTELYRNWLKTIQPWCISRQLWWGHRIPAWYGPDQTIFVAHSEEEALSQAQVHYGKNVDLVQDPDVLDTWFSSALWPFSTLGWPEKTPEFKRYYPTDVLVTGHDIIFFWVARMVMMGLYCCQDIPFRTVYVHPLVRDEKGQKMSKMKGNVVDPLEVMDLYGADALRLALAGLCSPGQDLRFSKSHVEGARNFITKLWNATRFCLMKGGVYDPDFRLEQVTLTWNQWIIEKIHQLQEGLDRLFQEFKIHEASGQIQQFIRGIYCDWYLEKAKFIFETGSDRDIVETQKLIAWVLGKGLHWLHPLIPFVTEELWAHLAPQSTTKDLLMNRAWGGDCPSFGQGAELHERMDWLMGWINHVRTLKGELNIPPSVRCKGIFFMNSDMEPWIEPLLREEKEWILSFLRFSTLEFRHGDIVSEPGSVQCVMEGGGTLVLPLDGVIDLKAEHQRLRQALDRSYKECSNLEGRLQNLDFQKRAPAHILEDLKKRFSQSEEYQKKLLEALRRLTEIGG